jgi:hypothetical protein
MTGRQVTFLGPWREGPLGPGKAMLGRRARNWDFRFTQRDEVGLDRILAYLRRPGVLAVFPGAAADDEVMLADALSAGVELAICSHHPLAHWVGDAAHILRPDLFGLDRILAEGPRPFPGAPPSGCWAESFRRLLGDRAKIAARRPALVQRASLCITHRERPAALRQAIESAGTALVETIVVDAGSDTPAASRELQTLETAGVTIVYAPRGTQQGAARNQAAEKAGTDLLVFLDDDNVFLDRGLERLISAALSSDFDIIVSNLRLYDDPFKDGQPAADLVFLGDAGSAGLIFNGFGDANFAIKRDALRRMGGFADTDSAAFDWLFFARARSLGLTIGVLQHPAIGYARNLAGRDTKWRTRDLEGPRRQLLEIYDFPNSVLAIAANVQSLTLSMLD